MNISVWSINAIENELGNKVDVSALKEVIQQNPEIISTYMDEIQAAVDLYNQSREEATTLDYPKNLFLNVQHLSQIWHHPLPEYQQILTKLQTNEQLSTKVFTELRESTYFNEVYEIEPPDELLHNLLILFYRTSMISLHPTLREKKAQISSTLEEMACVMALQGNNTHLYTSTMRWIQNWEEEEFSQQLFELMRNRKLL